MTLYIIKEEKGMYTGITHDLERRMKQHRSNRQDVDLIFQTEISEDNELVKELENFTMELLRENGDCLNKNKSSGMCGGYKLNDKAKLNLSI